MNDPLLLYHAAAFALLAIGLVGIIRRKTLVGMLIAVELMLNGAGLAIAASGQLSRADPALGQLCTLFVMGLAAAEATLILAIIIVVWRRFGSTRVQDLNTLRE